MSAKMRAKMYIQTVESCGEGERLNMSAISKNEGYGEDGLDENNTFATFTPDALLYMTINNPVLKGEFKVGDIFYVDFIPVD